MAFYNSEFDGTNGMDIARARIAWEAEHRTGELDLTKLDLEEVPPELAALSHLRKLRLEGPRKWGSESRVIPACEFDIRRILKNSNLEHLSINFFRLNDLSFLKAFPELSLLNCDHSGITSLSGLEHLPFLRSFDCSSTDVSSLEGLEKCINLQKLDCSETQINNLYGLRNCTNLQKLDCYGTKINNLGGLENCINLQELDCRHSKINSLAGLEKCVHLQVLICPVTEISSLEELRNCIRLQRLICLATMITSLKGLENCINLQELDCSYTEISSLSELSYYTNLQDLDCSNTQISSFAEFERFSNLRILDCTNIPMLHDERTFERLANLPLQELFIRVSPQTDKIDSALLSQHSADNCLPALRAHFADLRLEAQEQRDFKILVLGNGRSGKTQLVRRLCGGDFVEDWDSTHGIQLAQAKLPDRDDGGENRLHLWDFGGQELYHGTHALFLRQASAVIVNWAADTEQAPEQIDPHGLRFRNHPLGYWLSLLDNLAPAELPRLLIRSKSDQPDQITPIYPAGHDALTEIRFSAKTQQGLGQVRGALQDAIATSRQQHRYKIGAGRQKLINKLMALAQQPGGFAADQKIIDRATFRRWCQDIGQISDAEQCLIYLDRIGMLIYRPRQLGDRIILDQSWALNGIYTLFQRDKAYRYLRQQNGRFTAQDLADQVWQQDFTPGEQELFIDLMLASGICFRISPGRYLAPDLLPDRNRVAVDIDARWVGDTPAICQTVSYRFRHPGILRHLIGAIGRYTKLHALYWQTGLCAYDGRRQSRLLIEDVPDPTGWGCQLVLKAKDGQATDLLAWVLKQLDHIHQELGLHPEAPLPVPSETPELAPPTGSSRDYGWYVSYAWGDDSPEGLERKKVIAQLMADAQARNIAIRRDREQLNFGDDIRAFMDTLVTGQRIFILLSDKYLRSPFCTYELYHIWRESRQNADEFSTKVRIYQTPCARIGDPHQRAIYYQHWKTEVARLDETIALYDPADIPKLDQQMLHTINGFKGQIGNILAEIANRVQPRPWEDFIAHGFT